MVFQANLSHKFQKLNGKRTTMKGHNLHFVWIAWIFMLTLIREGFLFDLQKGGVGAGSNTYLVIMPFSPIIAVYKYHKFSHKPVRGLNIYIFFTN